MVLALSILIFLTIVVVVFAFGAATMAPSSVLGSRLREIGWQRPKTEAKPAMRERIQQALDPLLLLVGVPALGFFLPRFFLKRAMKERQRRIRLGLPDALDLTVICVEAG